MSSHCRRFPECGCPAEVGIKCHLPATEPIKNKEEAEEVFHYLANSAMKVLNCSYEQAANRVKALIESGIMNEGNPDSPEMQRKIDEFMFAPMEETTPARKLVTAEQLLNDAGSLAVIMEEVQRTGETAEEVAEKTAAAINSFSDKQWEDATHTPQIAKLSKGRENVQVIQNGHTHKTVKIKPQGTKLKAAMVKMENSAAKARKARKRKQNAKKRR